ncbi:MAG: cupredoxin domain-containing protein [Thermomicrobiales bacterium]
MRIVGMRWLMAVCVMFGIVVSPVATTARQASGTGKTVNVQLIVDASGSMGAATDTGALRIDAAKQVLNEVISAIPDVEGVNVGLRVYGQGGNNTEAGRTESCQSTELLVPMDGVDAPALKAKVDAIQPVGWTPLGLALQEAAKDFTEPASDDVVNAIVMVTDGLETCDADPVAIAKDLHDSDKGIITHVIGFGTTPEEQATLSGIAQAGGGELLGSNNAGQLMDALFSILEQLEVVEETGTGESRESPLGVGRIGRVGDYDISVISVTPNATDDVLSYNQFNAAPGDGKQFFLARIAVTYQGDATGTPAIDLKFQTVGEASHSYTVYNNPCGVYPEDVYSVSELFEGGSAEFSACWEIDASDAGSLVMYVEPMISTRSKPVWFSLGNPILDPVGSDGTPGPTATAEPSPTRASQGNSTGGSKNSSRESLIPFGETGVVGDFEVTVLSVIPNANDTVMAVNQFNEPPADGKQFFMARVSVKYVGQTTGNPAFELNYQAVGDANASYTIFNDQCGVYDEPAYNVPELFPEGTAEFNLCWQIDSQDAGSLAMYIESNLKYNEPATWFSLDPSAAVDEAETETSMPTQSATSSGSVATTVSLVAVDISFDPKDLTIPANTDVAIVISNEGVLQHDFVIGSEGIESTLLNGGESDTVIVNLPAGTYQFWCTVPGHKEAGMVGTLIVE